MTQPKVKRKTEEINSVVGFDLGHGETSLAFSMLSSNDPPKIVEIENKKSIVTAIGKSTKLGTVIGDNVFNIPDLENLFIAFKKAPSQLGFSQNLIVDYTQTLFSKIPQNLFDLKTSYVFIGCPSGWSYEDVKSYENLFKVALDSNVKVVKESRAALLQSKESGLINIEKLKSSIIVIDVGSLTTDISHVYAGTEDEKLDIGLDLGSGLIDQEIFERTLNSGDYSDTTKQLILNPEEDSQLKSLCLFACREAKETFFNSEDQFRNFHHYVRVRNVPVIGIDDDTWFSPKLNDTIMDDILNSPMKSLNGTSWINTFEQILNDAKSTLSNRGHSPKVVLLTGGASRMPFILNSCNKVFPKCDIINYSPPEETVSLGLVRWGKIYLQTSEFTAEIDAMCKEELPDVIKKYKDSFSKELAQNITSSIAEDCVKKAINQWRNGYIKSLYNMEDYLKNEIESWIQSSKGKLVIAKACIQILEPLTLIVNSKTLLICKKYNIPHSILEIQANYEPENVAKNLSGVYTPFEGVLAFTGILSGLTMLIGGAILKYFIGVGVVTPGGNIAFLAVLGAFALAFGTIAAKEKLKSTNLPIWMRKNLISDSKLTSIINKVDSELKHKLEQEIRNNQFQLISSSIITSFQEDLIAKANEVKWIIK